MHTIIHKHIHTCTYTNAHKYIRTSPLQFHARDYTKPSFYNNFKKMNYLYPGYFPHLEFVRMTVSELEIQNIQNVLNF